MGTNDLIQYTLAIDRNDDAVSSLYDPTHPAVLYLIQHTIKAANKAGLPVSVCGEMAGDARLTRLLLGMGLRKFSMHPANMLSVKQVVLNTHLDRLHTLTSRILRADDPDKIHDLLQQQRAGLRRLRLAAGAAAPLGRRALNLKQALSFSCCKTPSTPPRSSACW